MAVSRVPQDSAAFSRKHTAKSQISHLVPDHVEESKLDGASTAAETHSFQQLQQEVDVRELFALVRESGQRLVRTPSWTHAMDYRDHITRLLSQVISTSFSVEQHESHGQRSNKRYTTIVQVKEQVEAIVQHFLTSEKAPLDILGRVQRIEGLLVDIIS